ncbi:MAG: arsenate reductase ArsC [Pseudomonadota bacterium]
MNANETENVLFLCTGNSARSILGEVVMNALGQGRFTAFSAGSRPAGRVHPGALAELSRRGHDTLGLRSKSWDEYALSGAEQMRWIITVCDSAAGESCPVWPGSPRRVHWGLRDPAAAEPDEVADAFRNTYDALAHRIESFVALSTRLHEGELERAVRELGG